MRWLAVTVASTTLLLLVGADSALGDATSPPVQGATAVQSSAAPSTAEQNVSARGNSSCLADCASVAVGVNVAFAGSLNVADVIQVLNQVSVSDVGNGTIVVSSQR